MSTNRPPRNMSWRGDLSELEVASAPTRIQCRTGVLRDGHVVFRVYGVSGHQSNGEPSHL